MLKLTKSDCGKIQFWKIEIIFRREKFNVVY